MSKSSSTRADAIDPDGASEIDAHWGATEEGHDRLTKAARTLGVQPADVLEALGVERLRSFQGSPDDAERMLADYVISREHATIDELQFPEDRHAEARVIAWTNCIMPDGTQFNLTAREGVKPDAIVATVLNLKEALRTLEEFGIVTVKGHR